MSNSSKQWEPVAGLFTSESVTEGHPDKLCDKVSDAILDAVLAVDPAGRVACECMATTNRLIISGEITADCDIDYEAVARKAIRSAGYFDDITGFNGTTCIIETHIDQQSPDIDLGVTTSREVKFGLASETTHLIGAGDQGMMFGYASDETEDLMPLPITIANQLAFRLAWARKSNTLPFILPDGKTQVTVGYGADGKPTAIKSIVLSAQHMDGAEREEGFADKIIKTVIVPVVEKYVETGISYDDACVFINPTGRFVYGGPAADTGLTGRKIIVDTYGGYARHGGGAFSGKDPTKVDRSAAYMARYIAKNVVAAKLASKCEIQLAYAIGMADPVSILVDTFGTGTKCDDVVLASIIQKVFDVRPKGIIDTLGLRRPIYENTSAYGHFGNVAGITDLNNRPWEKTDKVEELLNYFVFL